MLLFVMAHRLKIRLLCTQRCIQLLLLRRGCRAVSGFERADLLPEPLPLLNRSLYTRVQVMFNLSARWRYSAEDFRPQNI